MNEFELELAAAFGDDWEQRLGRTYRAMPGEVPPHVRERWAAVAALGRPQLIEAIEGLRAVAIADNPLGLRVQQRGGAGALLTHGTGLARPGRELDDDRVGAALGDRVPPATALSLRAGRLSGSKSMVNPARSYPVPALACRDESASSGLTSVIPQRARLSTTSAADG